MSLLIYHFIFSISVLDRNRWVDTRHGDDGLKIYELYDPSIDSEISITLKNHKCSCAEWFKYLDDRTDPNELAIYCLSRKYGNIKTENSYHFF